MSPGLGGTTAGRALGLCTLGAGAALIFSVGAGAALGASLAVLVAEPALSGAAVVWPAALPSETVSEAEAAGAGTSSGFSLAGGAGAGAGLPPAGGATVAVLPLASGDEPGSTDGVAVAGRRVVGGELAAEPTPPRASQGQVPFHQYHAPPPPSTSSKTTTMYNPLWELGSSSSCNR